MARKWTRSLWGVSPWGTTEEFNARLEKKALKKQGVSLAKDEYQKRLQEAKAISPNPGDYRIEALYKECKRLNASDPTAVEDPYTVDHIRLIIQGGLHTRENMRIIRASKNTGERRSEEEIIRLTRLNILKIKGGL